MDPIVSGLLGVLIGALLGHRFALGRDKRKEWNAVVKPIKQRIHEHIDELQEYNTSNIWLDESEIRLLRMHLSAARYQIIKKHLDSYIATKEDEGTVDSFLPVIVYSLESRGKMVRNLRSIDEILKLK